jgi:hypothetical protein
MHLDDEQLQRFLHEELAPPATMAARTHIAGCGPCRARVDAARTEEREVFALLGQLDHRLPDVRVQSIIGKSRTGRMDVMRWAAGMLVAIGVAGAAYAAPGSPVRGWVAGLVRSTVRAGDPAPSPVEPIETPSYGGIAVAPDTALTIAFDGTARGGEVRVSLTDGADVVIRAASGAAEYTALEARVLVTPLMDSAIYEVEVPRAAARVEILVRGERMFLKIGSNVSGTRGFALQPR